jgi:hypothetical protein
MRKGNFGIAAGCEQNVLGGEQNSTFFLFTADMNKILKAHLHQKLQHIVASKIVIT